MELTEQLHHTTNRRPGSRGSPARSLLEGKDPNKSTTGVQGVPFKNMGGSDCDR